MSQLYSPKKRPGEYQVIIYTSGVSSRPVELKIRVAYFWIIVCTIFVLCITAGVYLTYSTSLKNYAPGVVSVEKYNEDISANKAKIDSVLVSIQKKTDYFSRLKQLMGSDKLDTISKLPKVSDESVVGVSNPRISILSNSMTDISEGMSTDSAYSTATEFDGDITGTNSKSVNHVYSYSESVTGSFLAFPPLHGIITRGIDPHLNHFGIDIATKKGTPVTAISGGIVIFCDWTQSTGNTIILLHPNNFLSVYKHLNIISVKLNTILKSGELVGLSGSSGEVTSGPHLHLELWNNGKYLNPLDYISGWENK